ncbi:hypothetical protein [Glaciecola sp. MF2-115]|uniref:hypothetical protein n=1 Tax=Glaciecola sp. MF2-115 TaxID=3384827 RepID=UPI0039A28857
MEIATTPLYAILASTLLLSCGGGGGGSEPELPQPTPAPAPTVDKIDLDMASNLTSYTVSVVESVYQIAQLINPKLEPEFVAIGASLTHNCSQQGTYTLTHVDSDNSENLTPSDSIQLSFEGCVGSNGQEIDGTAVLQILNTNDTFVSGYSVNLDLMASDEDGTVSFGTEGINIESDVPDVISSVSFRTVQYPFLISINNEVDTITSLDIRYVYDQSNLQYTIDFDFDVDSELLGIDFRCENTSQMIGTLYQIPNDYGFRCDANTNNYMSVTKSAGNEEVNAILNNSDGGSSSFSYSDADYYEGTIGFALGAAPESALANEVLEIRLNASNSPENQEGPRPESVVKVLYDKSNQNAYTLSSLFSGASNGPGLVLQKLNVIDMSVVNSQPLIENVFADAVRAALSKTGEYIYVYVNTGIGNDQVFIISTEDLSILHTVDLSQYLNGETIDGISTYLETVNGDVNSWIFSYELDGSVPATHFLEFDTDQLSTRGSVEGDVSAHAILSESPGVIIMMRIKQGSDREIFAGRLALNGDNEWEMLNSGSVNNAELGSIAASGQYNTPVLFAHDNRIFTQYGYVFSSAIFELETKLDLEIPVLSATSGIIFEGEVGSKQNMYGLADLNLQQTTFHYELPFSQNAWTIYKGTEEVFFYGSRDKLLRVGILLFD